MERRVRYQVKEVARAAGVSVRTLHHYDAIGLLVPSERTSAGYRLYTDEDLRRLQQIVIGRELGLALEQIRKLLDDPEIDRRETLRNQRAELVSRVARTSKMIAAIDGAIAEIDAEETTMKPEDLFDGFDPADHEEEVKERWGDTEAYKQSVRRTKNYSAEDWKRYKAESDAIMRDAAGAMKAGKAPNDPAVMDIAERHRLSIDQWFYSCSKPMHTGLADMYESDPRFAASIDAYATDLTPWWSAAIRANAKRTRNQA